VGLIKPGKETGLLELPYFYGHYPCTDTAVPYSAYMSGWQEIKVYVFLHKYWWRWQNFPINLVSDLPIFQFIFGGTDKLIFIAV